jgi:hypothetical protein
MLNFLLCFLTLAWVGFVFRQLWRRLVTPISKRFIIADTPTDMPQTLWFVLQVYIVLGWAAICVNIAFRFMRHLGVTHYWPYYILALLGCVAALQEYTNRAPNIIANFTGFAFIVFALGPKLTLPWRWFLKFLF